MLIETGECKRLTNDSAASLGVGQATACFSPDGSSITYNRLNKDGRTVEICIVSMLTGISRVIADSGDAPKWNSAGDRIYFYRGGLSNSARSRSGWSEYWSVSSQGTDERIEFIDSLARGVPSHFTFRLSPDGEKMLFTRALQGDYIEIFVRDLSSGKETKLTDDKKIIDEVYWTGNGYILYSSNRSGNFNIWGIPEHGGEATQITKGAGPDYGISYSKTANRLIFSQRTASSTVWMVNTDGTENRQLFPDENVSQPILSPDQKRIALRVDDPTLLPSLMVRDLAGGRQEMLFPLNASIGRVNPVWSPDGEALAYTEITVKDGIPYPTANILDMSGGHRIQELGEGLFDLWISDSLVEITRNISKDKKLPNYGESHLLNIHTGEEKIFFRDSTYAVPLLHNTLIGYVDTKRNFRILSRQEFAKNPLAQGTIINTGETSRSFVSSNYAYYVPQDKRSLWKMDFKTEKKTKIIDLSPGDNNQFYRSDYDADRVVLYTKSKNKTSIVKIDNLFKE